MSLSSLTEARNLKLRLKPTQSVVGEVSELESHVTRESTDKSEKKHPQREQRDNSLRDPRKGEAGQASGA